MRENGIEPEALSTEEQGRLARALMRRQGALSLRVAGLFVLIVFGVPVVNHLYPALSSTPVLGFTASWLVLGVLFYPITWLLSAYFVRQSDRIEAECAALGSDRLLGSTATSDREVKL